MAMTWTSDRPRMVTYRQSETKLMEPEPESGFPESVRRSLTVAWHLYLPSDLSEEEPAPSCLRWLKYGNNDHTFYKVNVQYNASVLDRMGAVYANNLNNADTPEKTNNQCGSKFCLADKETH